MKSAQKVIWTEGMFLRPHHFQQTEIYVENYIHQWGKALQGYFWGFNHLELDQSMLRQGKLALLSASGIMPDGTPFSFNGVDMAPPSLELEVSKSGVKVMLAIPAYRPGRESIIFEEKPDALARYLACDDEVDDMNAIAVGSAPLQFGQLRLRLMAETDLNAEWIAMGVVNVIEKRADNSLYLDPDYIPPMLNCHRNQNIMSYIHDIQALLKQRIEELSSHLSQSMKNSSVDAADFMLLQLLNRYRGQISHAENHLCFHPERLFQDWLLFSSELSTFTEQRTLINGVPAYDHDNLTLSFTRLILQLRQGLSLILEESAIRLPLTERSHGLNVATLQDSNMVREFGFVLAVKADVSPDMLRSHFPAQMKVAPVTRIKDLVQLQLPGINLRSMSAAPRQIPYHAGYTYFELEKGGELWKQMEKSGVFALHLAGDFPDLDMEFWAIRDQKA